MEGKQNISKASIKRRFKEFKTGIRELFDTYANPQNIEKHETLNSEKYTFDYEEHSRKVKECGEIWVKHLDELEELAKKENLPYTDKSAAELLGHKNNRKKTFAEVVAEQLNDYTGLDVVEEIDKRPALKAYLAKHPEDDAFSKLGCQR